MAAQRTAVARLAAIFFLSGAAGLFYEVIFSKSLGLTFGSTAAAATTVLATYMGGLALGSWLGGKLSSRVADGVRAYAFCEIGVAAFCALSAPLLNMVKAAYVALAAGSDPGAPRLLVLRVALGALALLPPTLLMGMTLPFLVRDSVLRGKGLGDAVGLFYGANTLGAALGAVLAGYAILPLLGVQQTTLLAVALNLAAALLGLRFAQQAAAPAETKAPPSLPQPVDGRLGRAALVVLAAGGVLTLALETCFVHLLAVVAGNSAFAFSLMLFAFLAGLGLGSAAGRKRVLRSQALGRDLAFSELALAAVLLLGVFYWDRLPLLFLLRALAPLAGSFGGRELVRFVACAAAMLPPALVIGFVYPVAMELVGRAWPARAVEAMGRAAALNTVGNVAGALLGGFVLVPRLGSLGTLHVLAASALALALVAGLALAPRLRMQVGAGALAVGALFALQPRRFNTDLLASGANVYFSRQPRGRVIDSAESLDGGLTTVHTSGGKDPVLTLNTNGKFQGNDARGGEMRAQVGFAVDSLLHAGGRQSALVIGFGTGTTTHLIERAGFERIDVAELSGDILRLADRHFRRVNGGVLEVPRVHAHIADGRNLLLLSRDRYDLISLEITSIWFAGAASLYNREFYQLVKAHLREHGVLQQWLQLHHLSSQDVVSVLASVRAEFAQVRLYLTGGQGIIVACAEECPASDSNLRLIDGPGPLHDELASLGITGLLQKRDLLLEPAAVEALLSRMGGEWLVSTDDNLRLEYSTPRGNVLPEPQTFDLNVRELRRFQPAAQQR